MFGWLGGLCTRADPEAVKKMDPKLAKQQADKKAHDKEATKRKEILRRQRRLKKEEVNQTWRVAVGKEIPKKLKDTILIKNVTRRNVWMEDLFVFHQIVAQFPGELFHPPSSYVLKWQPLGSYFQIIIPMDDPSLQENAVLQMARMTRSEQKKMLFLFTTLDTSMPLFAPKVHPSSLVSYRQKNLVLKKLSEYFIEGRITVDDIQQILVCSPEVWGSSLYNYLPEDEQAFHGYLNEKIVEEDPNKSIAKKYMDDEITLKEYEELKFPDRKKKIELESMYYPLPYEGTDCVICAAEKAGIVQCQNCDNMVCKACILSVFHGERRGDNSSPVLHSTQASPQPEEVARKRQSFLLMHHRYCMRLGELPEVCMDVVPESGWLRDFRRTTRMEIINRFAPKVGDFDDDEYLAEYEAEEAERKRKLAEQARERQLEAERLRTLMNPPELQERRRAFEECKKRLIKWSKETCSVMAKVQDSSHTEQFIARSRRVMGELARKFDQVLRPPLVELQGQLAGMSVPGDVLPTLVAELEALLRDMDSLAETIPPVGEMSVPSSRNSRRPFSDAGDQQPLG